jgi:hypothetical protein
MPDVPLILSIEHSFYVVKVCEHADEKMSVGAVGYRAALDRTAQRHVRYE